MAKKIRDINGNVYVKKKPFYKKWWFILLVLLVCASGCSKVLPDSGKPSVSTTEQTTQEQVASSSSSTESSSSSEPASTALEKTTTAFQPTDVSDATIKSIKTYEDYLTMYEYITNDYINNYEAAISAYGLEDAAGYQSIRESVTASVEEQKKQYGPLRKAPLLGKADLVQFLKEYRDELKTYTDSLAQGQ